MSDLRREVELRGDDFVGDVGSETAFLHEASSLSLGGTRDHNYRRKMCLGASLKKQRDIGTEPVIGLAGLCGARRPTGTNHRMQDVFERAAL